MVPMPAKEEAVQRRFADAVIGEDEAVIVQSHILRTEGEIEGLQQGADSHVEEGHHAEENERPCGEMLHHEADSR